MGVVGRGGRGGPAGLVAGRRSGRETVAMGRLLAPEREGRGMRAELALDAARREHLARAVDGARVARGIGEIAGEERGGEHAEGGKPRVDHHEPEIAPERIEVARRTRRPSPAPLPHRAGKRERRVGRGPRRKRAARARAASDRPAVTGR